MGHPDFSAFAPLEGGAARDASSLVLFVGPAVRPEGAVATELSRDGMRCLWRPDAQAALRLARHVSVDALCVDGEAAGTGPGASLARLRAAFTGPMLVVGSGVDPAEEVDTLRSGADHYLARPVPARRLCAHLLALVRRGHRPAASAAPGADASAAFVPAPLQAPWIEQLLAVVARPVAQAQLDGALSVRAGAGGESLDVVIRELRLRLR